MFHHLFLALLQPSLQPWYQWNLRCPHLYLTWPVACITSQVTVIFFYRVFRQGGSVFVYIQYYFYKLWAIEFLGMVCDCLSLGCLLPPSALIILSYTFCLHLKIFLGVSSYCFYCYGMCSPLTIFQLLLWPW